MDEPVMSEVMLQDTNVGLGLLFMLGSICCSVVITLILKYHTTLTGSRIVVLASNYIVAVIINTILWGRVDYLWMPISGVLLAIMVGFWFVLTFYLFIYSMGKMGASIPVSVMRLAVVLPILTAILYFGERPNFWQIPGMILAGMSFILFSKSMAQMDVKHRSTYNIGLLLVLFITMGVTGICLQYFEKQYIPEMRNGFLTIVFGVALICTWLIIIVRGMSVRGVDVKIGLLMGVPNGFSAVCFMSALHHLPDVLVFPVNDVSVVLLSTLGVYLIWREKLNRTGWVAL
ncbi:MAG: DMT family transporter, partial [Planctomycetes bacterium]|nr:DMT family transporter [Planctomycetota bacterium]